MVGFWGVQFIGLATLLGQEILDYLRMSLIDYFPM